MKAALHRLRVATQLTCVIALLISLTSCGLLQIGQLLAKNQPTVKSISPSIGPTTGNTSVVITGSNLAQVTLVSFGSVSAPFTYDSTSDTITAIAPPGSGVVHVTVSVPVNGQPDLTSPGSPADEFTYQTGIAWLIGPTVTTFNENVGSNETPDVTLQWNPVGTSTSSACHEADAYDVQISPDGTFSPSNTSSIRLIVDPHISGGQPLALPGMSSPITCTRGSNGVPNWSSPFYQVPWGFITSASPETSGQSLSLRVRAEFYGAAGPWSTAVAFKVPAPNQFFASNQPPDTCTDGNQTPSTFTCFPWQSVKDAVSYEVRLGNSSKFPSGALPTGEGVCNSTTVLCDDVSNLDQNQDRDGLEPWCGDPNWTNPKPWCALYPTQPPYWSQTLAQYVPITEFYPEPGGSYFWMVRAFYAPGQHGPWSATFAATVPNPSPPPPPSNTTFSSLIVDLEIPQGSATLPSSNASMWVFGLYKSATAAPASDRQCFGKYIPVSPPATGYALQVHNTCDIGYAGKSFSLGLGQSSLIATDTESKLAPGNWDIWVVFVEKCATNVIYYVPNVTISAIPSTMTANNILIVSTQGAPPYSVFPWLTGPMPNYPGPEYIGQYLNTNENPEQMSDYAGVPILGTLIDGATLPCQN